MPANPHTQPADLPEPSPAVKLWERVMGLDRNAPTAEQRWTALVYANAHGLAPYDRAGRAMKRAADQ